MRQHKQTVALFSTSLLLGIGVTIPAYGHAFGVRHQLEVPLYYYVLGAGLTVMLSFIIASSLIRNASDDKPGKKLLIIDGSGRFGASMTWAHQITVALSSFLFILILTTGLWGVDSPTRNFAPIFVWSLWWVGMVYVQALGMDVWRHANPWANIFSGFSRLMSRDTNKQLFPYPAKLQCWPAVFLFWGFAWLEQISFYGEQPRALVLIIMIYSLFTWSGMWIFGRDVWLKKAEVFSIIFSYLAAMAPLYANNDLSKGKKGLYLRPLFIGLLNKTNIDVSVIALMLLLLASVTFDGFRDTLTWADIMDWALTSSWLYGPLFWVQQQNVDLYQFLATMGLILTPLIFFISFTIISTISATLTRGQISTLGFAKSFVLSLLPISFAYHVAHYLTFLLFAGQLAIPVISDPYNLGWDLFNTQSNQLDLGVIGVSTTWWVAMGSVVIGHIYAVYLAHITAIRGVSPARTAFISQLPLIALMIGYTMLSLWILAQPIVAAD